MIACGLRPMRAADARCPAAPRKTARLRLDPRYRFHLGHPLHRLRERDQHRATCALDVSFSRRVRELNELGANRQHRWRGKPSEALHVRSGQSRLEGPSERIAPGRFLLRFELRAAEGSAGEDTNLAGHAARRILEQRRIGETTCGWWSPPRNRPVSVRVAEPVSKQRSMSHSASSSRNRFGISSGYCAQ